MKLETQRELDATREKLRLLQESYASLQKDSATEAHLRELTLRSLKHLINQFTEEIARFEPPLDPARRTA